MEDTDTEQKRITIEALRTPNIQPKMNKDGTQSEEQMHFEQFTVTDNGNGFNDANFKSFNEAYTQLKQRNRVLFDKLFNVKVRALAHPELIEQ